MLSSLIRLVRFASLVACLIVIASFVAFVVDEAGAGSTHQQEVVSAAAPGSRTAEPSSGVKKAPEGAVRRGLDDASEVVTAPFSGITAGWSSEWLIHGADVLLTLIIYGFAVGFVVRTIRVRV